MADIFVSYASDDRPTAQRIAEHLIAQGWSVWWDRDLTPGLEFAKEIEEVLRDARCVVVIWSGNSAESRWVQDEAREGLERGILVPVRIDESQVPLGFRGVQTADLSDWRGETDHVPLKRFEAALSALMDSGPRSPHENVAGPTGSHTGSHTGGLLQSVAARWATVAVVVLVAGIAALAVLSNDGDGPETPTPTWGTTFWHPIANSHQAAAWCPAGSFVVAFDIDEVPSADAQDSPLMSQALCATLAGASSSSWQETPLWVTVGAWNSHGQRDDWCPEGMYLVGLDQDRGDDAGPHGDGDAPIVGSAACGGPSGSPYTSSEKSWHTVGFTESMTPSGPWCPGGTFMTRFDLDGGADGHSYPIVASAECGRPAQ